MQVKHGAADVLQTCALPVTPLSSAEAVRVAIRSVGVNFHDTYTRTGLYPQDVPFTNGCEGAGVVVEVGAGVKHLAVGDRVAFFEYNCAYATEAVMPATSCFALPDAVSFELGAALLVQGLTAHYLATDSFALKPDSTCLIHAAGGGTGALLVQVSACVSLSLPPSMLSLHPSLSLSLADLPLSPRCDRLTGLRAVHVCACACACVYACACLFFCP